MDNRMDAQRTEFSNDLAHIVKDLSSVIFNVKSEEQMRKVFGMNGLEMKNALNKISDSLPEKIFQRNYKNKLEEIKSICAREFIFFQVQENNKEIDYQTNLKNFIRILSRDIDRKY